MKLHPPPPTSTSYNSRMKRYSPDKILKVKVTTRSKVTSRSDYDDAHLHPNQCTYERSTFYTLWIPRYSPGKIFKVKVTTARSNQGHTIRLHTYVLRFPKYSSDKTITVKVTTARSNQGHTMMLHTYKP